MHINTRRGCREEKGGANISTFPELFTASQTATDPD